MWVFIAENIGTIAVALLLTAVITAIIFNGVKARRKGGCGSCDGCPKGGCPANNQYKGEG